jgi:hypothetical protein
MSIGRSIKDIVIAMLCLISESVHCEKLVVCFFFLDFSAGGCVNAMDSAIPQIPKHMNGLPMEIDHADGPFLVT